MNAQQPDIPDQLQEKLNELLILQESLREAKAKADSYYEQLVRGAADFDNFRKRAEQRVEQSRTRGREEVAENVLAFADALERAQSSVTPQTPGQDVIHGLQLLHNEMEKLLRGLGVEPIKTKGAMFDPRWHEAVERVESEKPEGTIIEEVQRGYQVNDRVLRHARVRVSASPSTDSPNAA
jgi:molecular chaperone GrpE